MSSQQQAMVAQMQPLEGSQFDSMYLSGMATGHTQAVSLFESEIQTTQDPE